MSDLELKRPRVPAKCAPDTYVSDKTLILDDVRQAIQVRKWECKDLRQYYSSIRLKTFNRLMDGEDFYFSMRFAWGVAEAVGVDPAKSLAKRVKDHRERLNRPFRKQE